MTIVQLQYFETVCQTKSISRAAAMLYVSQPAVSVAIKELESEISVTLFDRQGKGTSLTREGRAFYEIVAPFLREYEKLLSAAKALGSSENAVRVGTTATCSASVFPQLLHYFYLQYPAVQVESCEKSRGELLTLLAEDKLDFAVMQIFENQLEEELSFFAFNEEPLYFCIHKKSPYFKQLPEGKISFEDVTEIPLVAFSSNGSSSPYIGTSFSRRGLKPNIFYTTTQQHTQISFIENGVAGGFLAKSLCENLPEEIACLELSSMNIAQNALVWKNDALFSRPAENFLQAAKELKRYMR